MTCSAAALSAQVFGPALPPAAGLGMGDATVAYPRLDAGSGGNDALPALGVGDFGLMAASGLPYAIGDWRTARLQAYFGLDRLSAVGVDYAFSGIPEYGEQRARLQYARRLADKLYLGAGFDFMRASAPEYGAENGFSFGLGALARALPDLWIGAQINNPFQQRLGGELMRNQIRLGACWEASQTFSLSGEAEKELLSPLQLKFGFNYRPVDRVWFRAGARSNPARASMGLGLSPLSGLRLDAAAEWHASLGVTPAFSLIWQRQGSKRRSGSEE